MKTFTELKLFTESEQPKMTPAQVAKKEEIVKSLKKKKEEFVERYGARWKEVMYATATKLAMEEVLTEAEEWVLGFQFDVDKSSKEGDAILGDLRKRFKRVYSGSGSDGDGFDVSFNGPKREVEKAKTYVEKKYKKQIIPKFTNFFIDESVELIEKSVRHFSVPPSPEVKKHILQTKKSEFVWSANSVLGGNSKFVVIPIKRQQRPGEDGVMMAIISNPDRGSRKIFSYMGTHRNVKGAQKFAKNNKLVESVELDEGLTLASDSLNDVKKSAQRLAKSHQGRTYYVIQNKDHYGDRYEVVDSVDMHMYRKHKRIVGYGKSVKESVELDEKRKPKATTFTVTPDYEFDGEKPSNYRKIKTLKIKVDARTMAGGYEEVEEYISDEISDTTGWLHNGFTTRPDISKVTESVELDELRRAKYGKGHPKAGEYISSTGGRHEPDRKKRYALKNKLKKLGSKEKNLLAKALNSITYKGVGDGPGDRPEEIHGKASAKNIEYWTPDAVRRAIAFMDKKKIAGADSLRKSLLESVELDEQMDAKTAKKLGIELPLAGKGYPYNEKATYEDLKKKLNVKRTGAEGY